MSLVNKFNGLMAHLNAEENVMALAFAKELERTLDAYEQDTMFLQCLEAAGVDNWCGYSEAWDMMPEGSDDE